MATRGRGGKQETREGGGSTGYELNDIVGANYLVTGLEVTGYGVLGDGICEMGEILDSSEQGNLDRG